jgi:hypothetical protein
VKAEAKPCGLTPDALKERQRATIEKLRALGYEMSVKRAD